MTTTSTATVDVSELADRHEVETLVHRVGLALDEGRFDDLRAIYTDDAVVRTPGGVGEGIDALVAQAARNHLPDDAVQHLITGVLIDLDPDGHRATVRANHVVVFAYNDPAAVRLTPLWSEPPTAVGAVYHFNALRTAAGWRLTSIVSEPVWASFSAVSPASLPGSRPVA